MEHAIGTKIELEVVEKDRQNNTCNQCFFADICEDAEFHEFEIACMSRDRSDHKDVIYKVVK